METEPASAKIETIVLAKPIKAPPSQWWTIRLYETNWGEWQCQAYPSLAKARQMHDHYNSLGRRMDPVIHAVTLPEPSKAFTTLPESPDGN